LRRYAAICDRTDYFNGDTVSDARRLAHLAGWRDTPEGDEKLGLCPEHAKGMTPRKRDSE
jgi:hypothetical protein